MLGFEAQQRVHEALRRIDQALMVDLEREEGIHKQAHSFRDMMFGAYQYLERESLQLKALLIQTRRLEANQLQVQSRGRTPFILMLDPELAYDRREPLAGGTGAPAPAETMELAARMFVVLAPPFQGVVRYYSIFGDGVWKRNLPHVEGGAITLQHTMIPRFSLDILVMEAAEALGQICTLHPTWAALAATAEALTFDAVRDRHHVKEHLTGLVLAPASAATSAPAASAAPVSSGPRLKKIGGGM